MENSFTFQNDGSSVINVTRVPDVANRSSLSSRGWRWPSRYRNSSYH